MPKQNQKEIQSYTGCSSGEITMQIRHNLWAMLTFQTHTEKERERERERGAAAPERLVTRQVGLRCENKGPSIPRNTTILIRETKFTKAFVSLAEYMICHPAFFRGNACSLAASGCLYNVVQTGQSQWKRWTRSAIWKARILPSAIVVQPTNGFQNFYFLNLPGYYQVRTFITSDQTISSTW